MDSWTLVGLIYAKTILDVGGVDGEVAAGRGRGRFALVAGGDGGRVIEWHVLTLESDILQGRRLK